MKYVKEKMARLRELVAEAAVNLKSAPVKRGPVEAGDVYMIRITADSAASDAGLYWAVIRHQPDDADFVQVIPIDDWYWRGTPDVAVSVNGEENLSARCGCSTYVLTTKLEDELFVGTLDSHDLGALRCTLAELARGTLARGSDEQRETDCDPEYEEWISLVLSAAELI